MADGDSMINTSVQSVSDLMQQIDAVIPTGKQAMLAKFNAYSGAFITCQGVVPLEYLNTKNFTFIEIQIDPVTQKVVGTKDSFTIVDIATSKTKIYETQVNTLCREKIYKRFHLEVQLDIIRQAVAELLQKVGLEDEALFDMNDYIDDVKRANKVLKQSYISNPDFEFITIEAEQAEQDAQLDGGLHELMGPANLVSQGLTAK